MAHMGTMSTDKLHQTQVKTFIDTLTSLLPFIPFIAHSRSSGRQAESYCSLCSLNLTPGKNITPALAFSISREKNPPPIRAVLQQSELPHERLLCFASSVFMGPSLPHTWWFILHKLMRSTEQQLACNSKGGDDSPNSNHCFNSQGLRISKQQSQGISVGFWSNYFSISVWEFQWISGV